MYDCVCVKYITHRTKRQIDQFTNLKRFKAASFRRFVECKHNKLRLLLIFPLALCIKFYIVKLFLVYPSDIFIWNQNRIDLKSS